MGQQEEIYIGIDLSDSFTQISYYRPGMKEPQTVSMVAGEERYRIPTALCKMQEFGPWHLADTEQKRVTEAGSIYVKDLFRRSLEGEPLPLAQEYEPEELLLLFLKKIIRLIPDVPDFPQIQAITFHLEELEMERVELLRGLLARIGIARNRIFFQDSMESFCHFAMNQPKELMQHDVLLFHSSENQLLCYYLTKEGRTSPRKVQIERIDLGELPPLPKQRDEYFAYKAQTVLQGKLVCAVYLTGEGLEGGWLEEALTVLCRGRRAFQGKNLYTKGACYGSCMQMQKEACSYVYFSEYKLSKNVYIQVKNAERTFFYDLAEAGVSCFEAEGSCEVLLLGEPFVDVWLQAPDSSKAKIESLELTDFPVRPAKATRLKIELVPGKKKQLQLRITDLGFGSWFAASGKVWEYCIDE